MKVLNSLRTLALTTGCAALVWTGASAAEPGPGDCGAPGIAPPVSMPYGKTYGQWSVELWKWVYSQPVANNALYLSGDVDLSLNQPHGPVWFLGGTLSPTPTPTGYGGFVVRSGTVPHGKALFFPIINCEWDNPTTPKEDFSLPGTFSTGQLRGIASDSMDATTNLFCEIIDVKHHRTYEVPTLTDSTTTPYRVISPRFDYWLPEGNVLASWGYDMSVGFVPSPSGTGWVCEGAAGDGFYLMLDPLPEGQYTIHFGGLIPLIPNFQPPWLAPGATFQLDITYHITVKR